MTKLSKRTKEIKNKVDAFKLYRLEEAVNLLKEMPPIKCDQTIDLSFILGIDPKKSDQQVRGVVSLPAGTGKKVRIAVIAEGEKAIEAENAGADYVGSKELLEKIKAGWLEFDVLISTPDMMRELGKLGKLLGPRGLMPTPKAGTVTLDMTRSVKELKGGRIEIKADKQGVVNSGVGKLSFDVSDIKANIIAFTGALQRLKPASSKGVFVRQCVLSSTMGPGLKVDLKELTA
jgi:large subunit ribosomal protein L1